LASSIALTDTIGFIDVILGRADMEQAIYRLASLPDPEATGIISVMSGGSKSSLPV
jgi:hypothetical protein